MARTNDESAEECVDPAHDEGVGDDHGHVVLHHAHHAVHGVGVGEGVGRGLALSAGVLEEGARLVGGDEVLAAGLEGLLGEDVVVVADGLAVDHGALLAEGGLVEDLGRGREEDSHVVSQDTGENHDDRDGDQDPVAVGGMSVSGSDRGDGTLGEVVVQELGIPMDLLVR